MGKCKSFGNYLDVFKQKKTGQPVANDTSMTYEYHVSTRNHMYHS